MNLKNIGISGLMMAGKDHIAVAGGYEIFGFADPMYQIAEHYFGTRDKSLPGMREFLQRIGQWGWGAINAEYPLTVERALWVAEIRSKAGTAFTKDFQWVDWNQYGTAGFWVKILLERVARLRAFDYVEGAEPKFVAVPNVRFQHEYQPLADAGFTFVHVMCSEETRQERMAAKGYKQTAREASDLSEQFAAKLNAECLASDRAYVGAPIVIWNDHRPSPRNWFISVENFLALVHDARNEQELAREAVLDAVHA